MKYKYSVDDECFVRMDNRGRRLPITWDEGVAIAELVVQGYKNSFIKSKLDLDVKITTLSSFVRNLEEGNIDGIDLRDYENMMWYDKCRNKFKRWLNG